MEIVVQKYGGSSLATPEQIKAIAKHIAKIKSDGKELIVVVSAMGKSTDQLVDLAYKISPRPNRRELDMLLTTGERVSMSLMSMALHDLNCPAISFTGSQAGVLTNQSHSDAKICAIRPIRIVEALKNSQVVVLAGFQGVDPNTKEITTLGRGGSDTTAVAMAAHFRASSCQMLKDVKGIYTADPKLVKKAFPLKTITYDSLLEMCFWGSNVLHTRSIELAQRMNVPLYIGNSADLNLGTSVTKETTMYEEGQILSVNSIKSVHHFKVPSPSYHEGIATWNQFIGDHKLPFPQILASVYDSNQKSLRLMCTGNHELLDSLENLCKNPTIIESMGLVMSAATVTCHGLVSEENKQKALEILRAQNIEIEKTISSPMSISFFMSPNDRETAVSALHSMIQT